MQVPTTALRLPSHSQVLVHEILSVHASRHPDFNTPCITLMLNSYGVAEGQRALDIVPNEATDYRVWMTGLQVRRDCRRDCPNKSDRFPCLDGLQA